MARHQVLHFHALPSNPPLGRALALALLALLLIAVSSRPSLADPFERAASSPPHRKVVPVGHRGIGGGRDTSVCRAPRAPVLRTPDSSGSSRFQTDSSYLQRSMSLSVARSSRH